MRPFQQSTQQPAKQGFQGHVMEYMTPRGVAETFTTMSIVCENKDFGRQQHNFCTEMLRWDDYRRDRGINDNLPELRPVFDTNVRGSNADGTVFSGHRLTENNATKGTLIYTMLVEVCRPEWCGAAEQNLSSEMLRWSDMRQEKNIDDGTPLPTTVFGSTAVGGNAGGSSGKFSGHVSTVVDSRGHRNTQTICVAVCRPPLENQPEQNFCSEMLRWDDYRRDRGINDGMPELRPHFDKAPSQPIRQGRPPTLFQ